MWSVRSVCPLPLVELVVRHHGVNRARLQLGIGFGVKIKKTPHFCEAPQNSNTGDGSISLFFRLRFRLGFFLRL